MDRFRHLKASMLPLWIGILMLVSLPLKAVERVQVRALFNGKAMLEIDGANRLLKAGDVSPEGVLLVSANPQEAVLEVDGRRDTYELGSVAGGGFAKPEKLEVTISKGLNGAFFTVGSINGRTTNMMVDTGATTVAMSEREAKRLNISYRLSGERARVSTASGLANAWEVYLNKVQVGPIALNNIRAMVVQGDSPVYVLLGMSFLERVEMENQGSVMILRTKF
jgi:aspartyl protease family protein